MKKQRGATVVELIVAVLLVGGMLGWILNVWDIFKAVSNPITGLFILRCVGVFVAPLGAILGYF